MELMHESGALEMRRLEAEAAEIEAAGHAEEAERLRQEQERLREQFELEAQRARIEAEGQREVIARETALRRLMFEVQESAARGDHERAARLEREAVELEHRLQVAVQRSQLRHAKLEQQQAQIESDHLREEIALAEAAGRHDEAREMSRELARIEREREVFTRHFASEERLRAMHRQLAEMAARLEAMQADGRDDQAAELERHIEKMHQALEDEELARED
jgi:hypothetical protein